MPVRISRHWQSGVGRGPATSSRAATLPTRDRMPGHEEKRRVGYRAEQMYSLVADVDSYADFLPWCGASRIYQRMPTPDGTGEVVLARLLISFRVFRETFTSRVTLHPSTRTIDVEYLDGPFRHLDTHWQFEPLDGNACEVDFSVDFSFRNAVLEKIVGGLFHHAMERIVTAFEERAQELYGAADGRGNE